MPQFFLATSNPGKIRQFAEFGCPYAPMDNVPDIHEPDDVIEKIVAYKCFMHGAGAVCEDTCMDIEWSDIDGNLIKFIQDNIHQFDGSPATISIGIGRNDGREINVWMSSVSGIIRSSGYDREAFGFDSVFVPDNQERSMHEIIRAGLLKDYSPRYQALKRMLDNDIPDYRCSALTPVVVTKFQNQTPDITTPTNTRTPTPEI